METRVLDSPPALAPLYARAAIGRAVPGRPPEPPDHAYALEAVEIDHERLADYARVCGFSLREVLPPTYPHLLGFSLAMALMTERSFPFSLLGLVHVANRIEQRTAIEVTALPGVRVWAESLRPHPRGRQIDLVTEVSVGGEVAWLEHSTYLRPGAGAQSDHQGEAGAAGEAGEAGGDGAARGGDDPEEAGDDRRFAEAPVSAVWDVAEDVGRRYAAVSGDRNPIHLHALSARPFGFPTAIVHGMWTLARCLASLDGRLTEAHTSLVRFRSPLRIPGRARVRTAARPGGWDIVLESPDGSRRHLELGVEA